MVVVYLVLHSCGGRFSRILTVCSYVGSSPLPGLGLGYVPCPHLEVNIPALGPPAAESRFSPALGGFAAFALMPPALGFLSSSVACVFKKLHFISL